MENSSGNNNDSDLVSLQVSCMVAACIDLVKSHDYTYTLHCLQVTVHALKIVGIVLCAISITLLIITIISYLAIK